MAVVDFGGRSSEKRSRDLETLTDVARTFVSEGSPRRMLLALTVVIIIRVVVGTYGLTDLVIVGVSLVLVGVVEWVIHLFFLHAPEDSWRMQKLRTGVGHRQHHLDPEDVGFILLRPRDTSLYLGLFLLFNATWPLLVAWALGAPLLSTYLSAVVLSYALMTHYEWTHLLVHTKYRPKTRYYKRLVAHHRLHHFRNEHYWLGVTSRLGDAALGTLPASKSDVPLSDTARTLES